MSETQISSEDITVLFTFYFCRPGGLSLQIPVHRSSFIVAASWNDNAYAFLRFAHTPSPRAIAMPRFVSFGGGDVCSFLGSLVLSFVPSFVRAFIRPSARWYWPCNWAQTLSSARPAKDYTPACPEGLEPNVLVWYIMLQIPVSDSRGEAGVNGVTFSVLRVSIPPHDIGNIHAEGGGTGVGGRVHHILDQTNNTRRGATLRLNGPKYISKVTRCNVRYLSSFWTSRAGLLRASSLSLSLFLSRARAPRSKRRISR